MGGSQIFGFGVHTWRHANLARLGANELSDELAKPLVGWGIDCGRSAAVADVSVWYRDYGSYKGGPGRQATMRRLLLPVGGFLGRLWIRFAAAPAQRPSRVDRRGLRLRLAGMFRPVASAPQSASDLSRVQT